jgi:hypothetical protein
MLRRSLDRESNRCYSGSGIVLIKSRSCHPRERAKRRPSTKNTQSRTQGFNRPLYSARLHLADLWTLGKAITKRKPAPPTTALFVTLRHESPFKPQTSQTLKTTTDPIIWCVSEDSNYCHSKSSPLQHRDRLPKHLQTAHQPRDISRAQEIPLHAFIAGAITRTRDITFLHSYSTNGQHVSRCCSAVRRFLRPLM